jgi:hypothetical protein
MLPGNLRILRQAMARTRYSQVKVGRRLVRTFPDCREPVMKLK